MRRVALLLVALAACTTPGVRSESAVQQTVPTTEAPPPETTEAAPEPTEPTDSTESNDDDPSTTEPDEGDPTTTTSEIVETGEESIGDSLFPELGTDDLDVQSYDVRLQYDRATRVIDGAVTITALTKGELDRLILDAKGIDVEAVTVDSVASDFALTGDELVITLPVEVPTGALVAIDVTYSAQAASMTSPDVDEGWFATAEGSYVINEPNGARTWLPSNDHPSDKATWRFEVTVPAGTTAVANGALLEQRSGPDGDTWVWDQRQPMATYLVQVLTGDYEILDRGVVGTIPIVDVALAEDVERMAPYFELTDDQLAFFEPLFGPYPLDRYGLAFADSFPGLAMETQGRSLFSRDDFPGGQPGQIEHLLLSHELAHQWFGDAVTPADWSDLWLNESFATYGQWLWLDHTGLFPLEAQADTNLAFRQDFTGSTAEPSVDDLFGYERYDGGAVVLHALRLEMGDDAFFTLLQRWVADNNGTSRRTEDFVALASEVVGRDLTTFFDAWLFAEDIPDQYPG